MNSDLGSAVDFLDGHNLKVNAAKTQPIIIGSNRFVNVLDQMQISNVLVCDTAVPYCDSVINLGLTFDRTISWKNHINLVVRKSYSILAQCRRNFSCLPLEIRKKIVSSLIFPIMDYGISALTNMDDQVARTLQKAQNSCIRFITGAKPWEHITPYYKQLEWLKIKDRQRLAVSLQIWKIIKLNNPSYLYNQYIFVSEVNVRINRSNPNRLQVPLHRTETYAKSFFVTSCKLWNAFELYKYINYSSPVAVRNHLTKIMVSEL